MLESMRNQAQSWIAKLILGGIALSFVLWGVGDYFTGSQVETVAEVDGKPIVDSHFYQAYERQLNSYRSMLGKQFSKEIVKQLGVKEDTIQTLVNRQLMLDEAQKLGLTAPEAALMASLNANPAFQSANGFDANRYRIITRNMGYRTTRDYEDEQRLNLMVDALQKAVIDSAKVSDKDILDHFNKEYEKRVLEGIIIDPASLAKDIEISEEQAREYYESHLEKYRSPLKVKLTAVEISPEAFAADLAVNEADIEAAYEARKAEFIQPEQRRASHILVRISKDADEATRAAARQKIDNAKARLAAGESFADVAKALSDDVTAENGGDLGYFKRSAMVPAFDEAVFGMAEGEISDVIETQFGFHIIQLTEIKAASGKNLADVHDELAADIRTEQAREEAYKISQDLDDALGMEDSLAAAAATLDLKVLNIGPISASEALGNSFLASDAELRVTAFSTLPGEAVNIQELDDGRFVAIEVSERIEPSALSFAEAAPKAYEDARLAEAQTQARALAEKILARASSETMDKLAQDYGQPKYISKAVRSNGVGDEAGWLTPKLLSHAFKAAEGAVISSPVEVASGFAVVKIARVTPPDNAEFEEKKETLRQEVEKAKGAVRFARWMASVRDNHDIIIHRDILERF